MIIRLRDNRTVASASKKYIEDMVAGQIFSYYGVLYMKLDSEFTRDYMALEFRNNDTGVTAKNVAVRLSSMSFVNKIATPNIKSLGQEEKVKTETLFPLTHRLQWFILGTEVEDCNEYILIHKSLLPENLQ